MGYFAHNFLKFFRRYWLSLILILICIAALWSVLAGIISLVHSGNYRPHRPYPHRAGTLIGPLATGSIQPWMTFDYINRIFNLPAAYLKTQLKIQNARYPRLEIGRYAEQQKINTTVFLDAIRGAIRNRGEN